MAAESGTMSAAAERLRVSQPAVSMSIRHLEGALGAQLIVRRPARQLVLTSAGHAFLPEARELLAHAQEVASSVSETSGSLSGRLSVGCFRSEAPFLLPGLLATFADEFPKVRVDFVEGSTLELTTALLDGDCELALTYDLGLDLQLEAVPLYERRPHVLVAAGDALAKRTSITLGDLAPRDMILFDLPPTSEYLDRLFSQSGLTPQIRYRTTSYELVRSLVARGLGHTLLINRPPGDISYEGLPVVAIPISDALPTISVVLARVHGARVTARARAFTDHCTRLLPPPWLRSGLADQE
jgi:DNA-binding transcriptional LysR family regulator